MEITITNQKLNELKHIQDIREHLTAQGLDIEQHFLTVLGHDDVTYIGTPLGNKRTTMSVQEFVEHYKNKWQDESDEFWLDRLNAEFEELAMALAGAHEHTPELELKEIASIAINWLRKRNGL